MPAIVADPGAVTPAWLTEVLAHAGFQCEVAEFSAATIGTGQVGHNVRFTLRYGVGSGPASIVGKFMSEDAVSRATGIAQNTYIKEVRFYRELLPTLDVQTPRLLFTDIDPDTHEFCLLMQDLTPAVQGNQIAGCSARDAAIALTELANLHGPRWADPSLHRYDWIAPTDEATAELGAAMYAQFLPGFADRYRQRLSAEHLAVAEQFAGSFQQWSLGHDGPVTVTHGDYRLDNMLFGGPYPVAIVDWQTVRIGAGASDLAYFLGAGLNIEDRRRYEQRMVRHYHDALLHKGVGDYEFEACWDDYRRYSFSGLLMAVFASMMVGQTERGDDMFVAMASRHAQQAIDLDAFEFLS